MLRSRLVRWNGGRNGISIPKLIPIFCSGYHLSLEQHSFGIVIPSNEGLSFHLSNSSVVIPFRYCLYYLTLLCLSTTNLLHILTPLFILLSLLSHSTFSLRFLTLLSQSNLSFYFLTIFTSYFLIYFFSLLSHYNFNPFSSAMPLSPISFTHTKCDSKCYVLTWIALLLNQFKFCSWISKEYHGHINGCIIHSSTTPHIIFLDVQVPVTHYVLCQCSVDQCFTAEL